MTRSVRSRPKRPAGLSWVAGTWAAGVALLLLTACSAKSATFRWGGMATVGRYVVNMDTLKRTGARVDFTAIFVPEATAKTPMLGKLYVRGDHWIDCARGMQARTSSQSFLMNGFPVDAKTGPDAPASPISPGTTWDSVRALVCTGRNDIDLPPLTGSESTVAGLVRARMAAHPVADPSAAN